MTKAGIVPKAHNYGAAITACGQEKDPDTAMALLEDMRNSGLSASVAIYNSAFSSFGDGDGGRAVELLEAMKREGVGPDDATCRAIEKACTQDREWEVANALLAKFRASVSQMSQ